MKPEDLRPGDILRDPDGKLWNVDQVLTNGGVLVVDRKAVYDLTGWKTVGAHEFTDKDRGREP